MPNTLSAAEPRPRPNVVFIAIDDQNDWVGAFGGHPLAKTPHINALAARGTALLNAHRQAPLCNPSRPSLMLSLRPTTTGIDGLAPWFRTLPSRRTASRCPIISRPTVTARSPTEKITTTARRCVPTVDFPAP